ncbi:MAG: serine hydroxymethyltransferase [Endozoicomonadaceae bacterium]|nr:serine hydroxymethyltransferase [Endozoicomonadaceae bacterium]
MLNQYENISISDFDPEIAQALEAEATRQEAHIELIASENYVTPLVMAMQGSVLTNKYAEGYPGKRYYGGCEHVDVVEKMAIERSKSLFKAAYANVQPHSGSQANAAVFMALLKPGDTFLGMSLAHGGHLTHGANVSFSGRLFHAIQYGIDEQGQLDYVEIERLAKEHKPKLLLAGFSAYSGRVDWARFRDIADTVGAYLFVDMAHVAGLVAAGQYPSPIPYAHVVTTTTHKTLAGPRGGLILSNSTDVAFQKRLDFSVFPETQGGPLCHVIAAKAVCFKEAMEDAFRQYQKQVLTNAKTLCDTLKKRGYALVSNGTENHLVLVNLIGKPYTGKEAEQALGRAHLTVNKNTVPNDPNSPFVTSGLRLGTPAMTRRGFKEKEAQQVGHWIADVLDQLPDETVITDVKQAVKALCQAYPVYKKSL